MSEAEELIKKIEELQENITDSKENGNKKELAEYLVTIKKLEARLSVITERILNNK